MTVQTEEPVAGEIVQYAPPAGVWRSTGRGS